MKNKVRLIILICIFLISVFMAVRKNIHYNFAKVPIDKNKPSVAITYIALGRYNVFWKEFYETSERYLLPGYRKEYFLYISDKNTLYKDYPNVHVIETPNLSWPLPALLQYDMILHEKKELEKFDYIFFFNADFILKKEIGEQILPDDKHDGLVFATQCAYENKPNTKFPYERNSQSAAYIPYGKGKVYVPGGIKGGKTKEFLDLAKYCNTNIQKDLRKKIIPQWHDEAYTNKYILDKNPLILPENYMDTGWCLGIGKPKLKKNEIYAQIRDKQKYGGRMYLRGISNLKSTPWIRFKYKLLAKITKKKEYIIIYKLLCH